MSKLPHKCHLISSPNDSFKLGDLAYQRHLASQVTRAWLGSKIPVVRVRINNNKASPCEKRTHLPFRYCNVYVAHLSITRSHV